MNQDETLSIKYPLISSINWEILSRVDQQMEEGLQQCQQDFIQYEQVYQNIIKEVNISFSPFFIFSFLFFRFASYNMNR